MGTEKDKKSQGTPETQNECEWFEKALETTEDLSDENSKRFDKHLEECPTHRAKMEKTEELANAISNTVRQAATELIEQNPLTRQQRRRWVVVEFLRKNFGEDFIQTFQEKTGDTDITGKLAEESGKNLVKELLKTMFRDKEP